MERKHDGHLGRLAIFLERECHFAGIDIEVEITKIRDKIQKKHSEKEGKLW